MPEYYQVMTDAAVVALEAMAKAASEPMWTDVAAVIVAGVVGLGQCGLIAYGIHVMKGSNESREAGMEALRNQHQETMTTLQTNHDATMATVQTQAQVLAEIGAGIREQSAGIREVLERTSVDRQRLSA